MPKLTARQESVLKKHSKHHTAKHMAMMRKEMKAGKSFTAAHKKAKAMERKMKKKRGGKMRKKGAKGAPTAAQFARAKQTARKR